MEKETLLSDVQSTMDISLNSYIKKCEQASAKVGKLLERLDSVLDKSLEDERPTYACGNALEDIKEVLEDTALQMEYVKRCLSAKVGAWVMFPGDHDGDEDARRGYICGYMNAKTE